MIKKLMVLASLIAIASTMVGCGSGGSDNGGIPSPPANAPKGDAGTKGSATAPGGTKAMTPD